MAVSRTPAHTLAVAPQAETTDGGIATPAGTRLVTVGRAWDTTPTTPNALPGPTTANLLLIERAVDLELFMELSRGNSPGHEGNQRNRLRPLARRYLDAETF